MRLQTTPPWLTREHYALMAEFYALGREHGMHVDHRVPLRGKTVWGLHVPWNLQLLTPSENSRKSNTLC